MEDNYSSAKNIYLYISQLNPQAYYSFLFCYLRAGAEKIKFFKTFIFFWFMKALIINTRLNTYSILFA